MGRKGDLFMLGLNMLFLVAIILVFWKLSNAFRMENESEGLGTRQTALLQTYATAEEMLLYLDTAATFSAYEAQAVMLEKGAVDLASSACGSYAGYASWSASNQNCVPPTESLDRRFATETLNILRGRLPSFPGLARYETSVVRREGLLVLHAITMDKIELPIVTAKRAPQAQAAQAVEDERAASMRHGAFPKDTSLPAIVEPAQRRETRAGPLTGIVIFSTDADASEFVSERTVHYYIHEDGSIVQLVPESERAFFCEGCPEAVGIAVRSGEQSYGALVRLSADVAKRNSVELTDIRYMPEVTGEKVEGYPSKQALIADIVSAQNAPPEEEEEKTEEPKMAVAWPTTSTTITSCWGPRSSLNDFHDGIDMGGDGNPVFAYADGVVHDTCNDGGRTGCRGYGRYIVIEHPNGLYTRYSHLSSIGVRRGDSVRVDDTIGRIGNAGRSEGPHLDFKVYNSSDLGGDKGMNPLCYFPEEMLAGLDQMMKGNCKYGSYSLSDPKIRQECNGISGGVQADRGCFTGGQGIAVDPKGDAQLTATVEKLEELGLVSVIQDEELKWGVDAELVIAIIAKESGGEVDYVNSVGAVGIGQIKPGAAEDLYNNRVFPSMPNPGCTCPGTCRAASVPACRNDVRLKPEFAVPGVAAYLALQKTYLEAKGHRDLTDMTRLAVASYNQGAGTISSAINKAKSRGVRDPTWDDIVHDVPEEGQRYVPAVMGYYAALGGSTVTAFSDQRCEQLTVKQMGTYAFAPSFTVEVPNALGPMDALARWAEGTVRQCRGQSDNRACISAREQEKVEGVEFVSCSEVDETYAATAYREAIADCAANRQEGCWCAFKPAAELRLYGQEASAFVDGERIGQKPTSLPQVLFAEKAGDEPALAAVSLEDGEIVTWSVTEAEGHDDPSFGERDEEHDLEGFPEDTFGIYKQDNETLVWVADPGEAPACGAYKETHLVCARLDTKTYRLGSEETEQLIVRFALHLTDDHDPLPITEPKALTIGLADLSLGLVTVTFKPSASEDVSYYLVSCTGVGLRDEKLVPGRTLEDERIEDKLSAELFCGGITPASSVTIQAFDISGREMAVESIPIEELTPENAIEAVI